MDTKAVTEKRPWGYYTILIEEEGYKAKKIVVNPGQRLSLQFHKHRAESWTVVKGSLWLTLGEISREYTVGESINIKKEELHRMENKSSEPGVIIEVQTGSYLGEDDIVRIEDDYKRTENHR